ncbi:ABC transporter permease [Virgibacillus sp. NKC19-16]|uniref:ABC transporter permease n=1 Tax=Virgibacillus salidurans TaxID=2831673 RepID=UPI001F2D67BB|nr:ABC transporter permease [Virgibacillus sp. NKC19-16]UJL45418.1 ABC transporter permease [Virgibacillus sp. NKC19-16]
MINIFKMDLQRFKNNKIMYLLLLIYAAFQLFGVFMMSQYPVEQGGIPVSSMNASEFIQLVLSQTPSWVLMYVAVFSVYFYMSEYNSGFYKNYISMNNARMYSVISKILILGLFTLFMLVTMVISDLIGRTIFFNNAAIGDLGFFIKLLVGQFLLHWAFSIVVLFISIVSRSMITSLVIGVVLALNVPGMLVGALESLIGNVNVSSYMLVNTIVSIKDFNNMNDVIHVAGVAIIFILLFSFIAARYKMKEDLR